MIKYESGYDHAIYAYIFGCCYHFTWRTNSFWCGWRRLCRLDKKPTGYNEAVALIAAEKYQEAIPPLQSAEKLATTGTDIQNLLGFTHRKTGKLDAAPLLQACVEINPKHKGALEYQGELFLILGDKDAAANNLEKLDKSAGWDAVNMMISSKRLPSHNKSLPVVWFLWLSP